MGQREVLQALREEEWMTLEQIIAVTGCSLYSVKDSLERLRKMKKSPVECRRGKPSQTQFYRKKKGATNEPTGST